MTDLIIIGAGPAGITAAIYAARAGLKVSICEKNIYGGQVSTIDKVENYPGFKSINGVELATSLYEQAVDLGVNFIFEEVISVDLKLLQNRSVTLKSGEKIKCKSVIIASGLSRKNLGCQGEKEFAGKGVSYCATCDGSFFKSKDVIVVGGGNTALEDALYLSNICSSVTLVVRKNFFRAENITVDLVKSAKNINIKFETQVKEIKGNKFVTSAILENKEKVLEEIFVEGIFVAIGYKPDFDMFKYQIELDENGYFAATEDCTTSIEGIYVAGDCRTKNLRQIVTATSDGAVCGNKAAQYVLKIKSSK